jgi:HEAT repeat protein
MKILVATVGRHHQRRPHDRCRSCPQATDFGGDLTMGNETGPDVPAVVRRLTSPDVAERTEAAELLARAGAAAVAAALPLVTACGDEDEQVREWAVAALEDLGPPPAGSLAALSGLVSAANPLVAYWATTLLGRSGQDAASATTALATAVQSAADSAVRERAAWALGRIGPAAVAARGSLEQAAASGEQRLARLAAEALAAIGVSR